MQKVSDVLIQNIKSLPIWVKQVITKEIFRDLEKKLTEFSDFFTENELFQFVKPKVTLKGRQECQLHTSNLSDGYYAFLNDAMQDNDIFEITIKNSWSFSDTAKIFVRLFELEMVVLPDFSGEQTIAIAMFVAGKIKTGEFLKRIKKIDAIQLEQAIRYQKKLNDEGRHVKMASILIKLGFITDTGLDSLLLLKEEAKKRLPVNFGVTSLKFESSDDELTQLQILQKEISRLENENLIMKKRLKKLLNLND